MGFLPNRIKFDDRIIAVVVVFAIMGIVLIVLALLK
jgi:hypothetical protein